MRKDMFKFAGFLTLSGLTALGIFAAAFRWNL
jgi:energy-converting hydrogenase Eha subunit H